MHADGGIYPLWAKAETITITEAPSLPPGGPIRNYKHSDCYIMKERQAYSIATSVTKIEINDDLYDYRCGSQVSRAVIFTKLRQYTRMHDVTLEVLYEQL
jgi:hypothetical protein